LIVLLLAIAPFAAAEHDSGVGVTSVVLEGDRYSSWQEYSDSAVFKSEGRRCGTGDREMRQILTGPWQETAPSDCSSSATNPTSEYDPSFLYTIPVVVHIIMDDYCTVGAVSDDLVHSQINILNEDFLALTTTNGANGTALRVLFYLATEDADGNPTLGITRSCNSTWYNDSGAYYDALSWDPHRFLNIYTNSAHGWLGYVPFLPADNNGDRVGQSSDRVVILWSAFGRDAPYGPPYDQGRTVTHEVGHYLGLEHPFARQSQCGSTYPPGCYNDGDLICDTAVEETPNWECPVGVESCGSPDPVTNYMDYTDDLCMEEFTREQSRRMRCTLGYYRPNVRSQALFVDNFESGNTLLWEDVVP